MKYRVYDVEQKKFIEEEDPTLILKPSGRLCQNDYGDEVGFTNKMLILFFPRDNNENWYIDEIGGIHEDGLGWDPNSHPCGECSFLSCSICPVWNKINKEL